MNAFLTIMAAIGILVSLFVLTILFVVFRVILRVRRGLAQAGGIHIVHPHRRGGGTAESDFAQVGAVTLAAGAWTSADTPAGDTCQTSGDWSDNGSSGSDCGSSDAGGSSGSGSSD